jgi:hypothetical protein
MKNQLDIHNDSERHVRRGHNEVLLWRSRCPTSTASILSRYDVVVFAEHVVPGARAHKFVTVGCAQKVGWKRGPHT